MKIFILLITILINFTCKSQNPVVIDKSETTKAIFDYNDPFSLISLLYNNQSRAIDMDATGMDKKTLKTLVKKGWSATIEKYWDEADSYQIYNEAEDTFTQSQVDTSYYDLAQINRITITKDTVLNKLTGEGYIGIDRLAFYKQYKKDGKHYKVFECSYTQLVELNGFKARYKTNDLRGLDTHKFLLMEMFKKHEPNGLENQSASDIGVEFFPTYQAGNNLMGNRKLYGGNYDGGEMYPRELNTPTLYSAQSTKNWMNSLPFTSIVSDSVIGPISCNVLFDSCYMHNDSYYDFDDDYMDEVLVDYYNYYWVDVPEFEVYIQADFYTKDPLMHGSNSLNIEKYIYTAKVKGYTKPLVIFEYNSYSDPRNQKDKRLRYDRVPETLGNEEYLLDFKMLPCFKLIRKLAE